MKIIGKTSSGFIVEMSRNEIAKIQGYEDYCSPGFRDPEMGAHVEVSETWRNLRLIRENKKQLSIYAREIRAYADLLEYKEPEINKEVGNDVTS